MLEEFEYNGQIMGTNYSIAIICSEAPLAKEMFDISLSEIQNYERIFSRFSPTSELSILNDKKKLIVSPIFLAVISKAKELFIETQGFFNPLVQVSRIGYNKNFINLKFNTEINNQESYNLDFSKIIIDSEKSMVHLQSGQKLDFGGFLKGYLAEIIAKKIMANSTEIRGVIVNLGGDIHTRGLDRDGQKFSFQIYNPVINNGEIKILLYNQSLATSGTYKRTWQVANQRFHHILDQTGLGNPKTDIVSASIVCPDGARSEAYTKVFLARNHLEAMELLKQPEINYIIINKEGEIIKNENIL